MTDMELWEKHQHRPTDETFKALITRFAGLVYVACQRQLGDAHLAEDAAQAVFVLLHRKAGKVRGDRLAGWLLTAARYVCANMRKQRARQTHRDKEAGMDRCPTIAPGDASPSAQEVRDMLALLDDGLGKLSPLDRQAIVLRYLQDQSLHEVGQALGISQEAARKRVDRALEKLRRFFARRGVMTGAAALALVMTQQAQAATLAPATTASILHGTFHAIHAGAAGGAVTSIAQGANLMMTLSSLKPALLTAALALGLGVATLVVAQALPSASATPSATQPAAAPAPMGGMAAAPAPAPSVDLSTPVRALLSLFTALETADRDMFYACITADPRQSPTAVDAAAASAIALIKMKQAAVEHWGEEALDALDNPNALPIDKVIMMIKPVYAAMINTPAPEGDRAALPFGVAIPKELQKQLPPVAREFIKSWEGRKLYFRKTGQAWKFDMAASLKMNVTFYGPDPTQRSKTGAKRIIPLPEEQIRKLAVPYFQGLERYQLEIAQAIRAGKVREPEDVLPLLQQHWHKNAQALGITGSRDMMEPGDGKGYEDLK